MAYIALFTDHLSLGGMERVVASLGQSFARSGHRVDWLFFGSSGPHPVQAPAGVNVVDLRSERRLGRLVCFLVRHPMGIAVLLWICLVNPPRLTRPHWTLLHMLSFLALFEYLRCRRPSVIYSSGNRPSTYAPWAVRLAGAGTRVVITQHNPASVFLRHHTERLGSWRARLALRIMRCAFLRADAIVSVSDGTGDDLSRTLRIPRERIVTIYNPAVGRELPALAKGPLDHPWFRPGAPPVILGAGRLVDQKDFQTLIRAFARVRRRRLARLVILGEGEQRSELEVLAAALNIAEDVDLPGFAANPFAYMSRAGVFVLSSKWEGLSMVIIEALACDCPIVSTDCIAGPSEILRGGIAPLVPVGDDEALAAAIIATLDNPQPREGLIERGMWFTVERAVAQYAQYIPG